MADDEQTPRSAFARAAPELRALGYSVVPIGPKGERLTGKSPGDRIAGEWRPMSDWPRLKARLNTDYEIDIWSAWPDAGIGIVMGSTAKGLQVICVDIDLTDQDEIETLKRALPRSGMSKFGAKGMTLFYRADPEMQTRQWRTKGAKKPFVELLTGRETRQTVVPPTTHPDTGRPYHWLQGPIPAADLPILTAEHIEAFEETLEKLGWSRDDEGGGAGGPVVGGSNVLRPSFDGPYAELNSEAMARLSDWAPKLDLYRFENVQGHRYKCVPTWREGGTGRPDSERKQNLSIHPTGIKDFGTNQTYSPIDLVMAARGCDTAAAFLWLDTTLRGDVPAIILPDQGTSKADVTPEPVENDEEQEAPARAGEFIGLPEGFCFPRGLVGDIARWIVDTATKPQPVLAMAAALTVVGTAMGRQYAGPTRTGTHIYALGLAPTGSGKDHPLKCAGRLMAEAGMGQHLGPGEFISSTAVVNTLTRSPLCLCLMDEFGAFLARINSRRAGGFEKAVGAILRSAWGSSFSPMPTPEWAQKRSQIIHAPAMSIFGVSTPEEFFGALTGLDSSNGVLNRVMIFPSIDRPRQARPAINGDSVPVGLTEGLKAIMHTQGGVIASNLNMSDANPAKYALQCGWSQEAEDIWRRFVTEIDDRSDGNPEFAASHSRAAEYAQRLAVIVAAGRAGGRCDIDRDDIEWAITVTRWSFAYVLEASGDYIADTDAQARAQEIVRALKARRGKASHRELMRALAHKHSTRDVKDTLQALTESGRIDAEERRGTHGGRPTVIYRLT